MLLINTSELWFLFWFNIIVIIASISLLPLLCWLLPARRILS